MAAARSGSRAPASRQSRRVRRPRAYVVTGGAGFIASNLAAELLRRDPSCRVTIVDDFSSGSYENIVQACARKGVRFTGEAIAGKAGDVVGALLAVEPPDALFHLGATTDTTVSDEPAMLENNAGPWWGAMLASAIDAGVRVVYASSAATYGTPPHTALRQPFPLDAAGKPNNVYGFSKWVMENTHRAVSGDEAARSGKVPWIVGLRYFNVFGPGEARKGKMASMAFQLAQQCLSGKSPRLFEHGEQARDQVHVDDVVDCTLAAAGMGPRGDRITPGVYNLGSGLATSFNDVAAAVRRGLGLGKGELEVEYFAMPESVRAFYQDFTQADMSQTEKGLGWKPMRDPVDMIASYAAMLKASRR